MARPSCSRTPLVAVPVAAALLLAGCGASDGASAKEDFARPPLVAADFGDPRAGANPWLPLVPGTQWVREGTTLIGNREVPHTVVSTVTDAVRVIDGVRTVLVFDHSLGAGQIVQQSLDYMAQDTAGAVWLLGGATEQYEAGRYVTVDEAWVSGVDGAAAGILMPPDPTADTPPWSIARPPEEPGDAAEFVRIQPQECVPFGCFDQVLVIREGKESAIDNEFKYYARGVGQIRNEPRQASRHEDVERLLNVLRLSPEALTEVTTEALRVDERAAAEMPELFGDAKATRAP